MSRLVLAIYRIIWTSALMLIAIASGALSQDAEGACSTTSRCYYLREASDATGLVRLKTSTRILEVSQGFIHVDFGREPDNAVSLHGRLEPYGGRLPNDVGLNDAYKSRNITGPFYIRGLIKRQLYPDFRNTGAFKAFQTSTSLFVLRECTEFNLIKYDKYNSSPRSAPEGFPSNHIYLLGDCAGLAPIEQPEAEPLYITCRPEHPDALFDLACGLHYHASDVAVTIEFARWLLPDWRRIKQTFDKRLLEWSKPI